MRPVKCKELYSRVAENCSVTEEEVKAISEFFWGTVRNYLTRLEDIRVHITNLGDFTIKHWLIDKEIEKCGRVANLNAATGAQKFSVGKLMEERRQILLGAKQMYQEENQRKEFIYNHKKLTHETKQREFTEDMEE